jgi:hypothetical protein
MAAPAADVVSPELVLVCPELRAAALAALPAREPDAWLDRPAPSSSPSEEYRRLWALADADEPEPEWVAPLPVAVAAYTLQRAAKVTVEMTALLGAIAALLSIVAVARW